ncbi:MAG: SPASM domain-containing protein [Candidatus Wallbacteria bacterium]|nr:SPASM domain-containing protein [Candidatus Wallbacteria bacterium]
MLTTLILELTNFCNLNCIMCSLPRQKLQRGFMRHDLLEKILSDLRKEKLKFNLILPFWSGESSLHPQFRELLGLIFEANKDFSIADGLAMDTNLNSWDRSLIDFVLKSRQFVVLHFSLDAVREETYRKIRVGGDFRTAQGNALDFLKRKAELGLAHPNLVFQFIVLDENRAEAREFRDFWATELKKNSLPMQVNYFYDQPGPIELNTIFIRRCDAPCGKTKLQLKYEELHRSAVEEVLGSTFRRKDRLLLTNEYRPDKAGKNVLSGKREREICAGPFTHLSIKYDGRASLCCQDTDTQLAIGNAADQSIRELWFGERTRNLRLAHLEGKLPPRCRDCFNQVYPLIKPGELVTIKDVFGL